MMRQENVSLPLPVGYIFPTIAKQEWIDRFVGNLTKLFREEGYMNGMAFAQVFIEHNDIYLCEIGYRLTPSFETFVIKELYGFDPISAMVDFAMGNKVDCTNLEKSPRNESVANITCLLKSGTISKYEGIDEVQKLPFVLKVLPAWEIGHRVKPQEYGTLKQVGLRMILRGRNREELINNMDSAISRIKIIDENGNDMVIRGYSYKGLCE